MDRKQLKAQSKNLIRTAQPKPVVMLQLYHHMPQNNIAVAKKY